MNHLLPCVFYPFVVIHKMSFLIRPVLSGMRGEIRCFREQNGLYRVSRHLVSSFSPFQPGNKVVSVPPPAWSSVKDVKLPSLTNTMIEKIKMPIMDRPCNKSVVAPDSQGKITALFLPALNPNVVMEAAILKRLKVYRPYKPKNMLRIRREKMNKHRLRKFRRKYMAMLKKIRTKRNIKKEKLFRAELLSQVREAEKFDAEVYVKNVLGTIDRKPKRETLWERRARYLELMRVNKSNVTIIRPKFDDPVP